MTTLTIRVPMIISVGEQVEELCKYIETDLDGQCTQLAGGTFTVTVADDDVRDIRHAVRTKLWTIVEG